MKKYLVLFLMLIVTIVTFGQVVDSTATVTYNFGESFKTFLDRNLWTFIAVAFFILSEYLGTNTKIKENAVYKWIFTFISNMLKKKAGVKIILLAVLLSGIAVSASAQGKFKGFFKPVENSIVTTVVPLTGPLKGAFTQTVKDTWLFRPSVQLSAMQLYYNKDLKQFDASSFESMGVGLSYQHFIQSNNEAVSNFGVNALLLFDGSGSGTAISPAVTVTALQYFNIGTGYNTLLKKVFFLTGISYSFN